MFYVKSCPDYYNGLLTHLPTCTLVLLRSFTYRASTIHTKHFHLIITTAPALSFSNLHSSHTLLLSVPHTHRALSHLGTSASAIPLAQDALAPALFMDGSSESVRCWCKVHLFGEAALDHPI